MWGHHSLGIGVQEQSQVVRVLLLKELLIHSCKVGITPRLLVCVCGKERETRLLLTCHSLLCHTLKVWDRKKLLTVSWSLFFFSSQLMTLAAHSNN